MTAASNNSCNPQLSSSYCTPEVEIDISHDLTTYYSLHALCDSGAEISVIPLKLLPEELKCFVSSTGRTLTGVGGNSEVVGEIYLNVRFSNESNYKLNSKMLFLVNAGPSSSVLLGQNILYTEFNYWYFSPNRKYVLFCLICRSVNFLL